MAMTIATVAHTPGAAIQICQKEDLDAFDINWPLATASNTVENFAHDERNPAACYVYPPPSTACYVELLCVKEPTACENTSSNIDIPDRFATALRYLTLAIAYEKDIEGANPARAEYYRKIAIESLGIAKMDEEQSSPNANNADGMIARTGGK